MKRAQVRDAIGWMLVAADRYPGLSVRTRNGWRPCSGPGWDQALGPAGPSRAAHRPADGGGNLRPRSPLQPLGMATLSLCHVCVFKAFSLWQSFLALSHSFCKRSKFKKVSYSISEHSLHTESLFEIRNAWVNNVSVHSIFKLRSSLQSVTRLWN